MLMQNFLFNCEILSISFLPVIAVFISLGGGNFLSWSPLGSVTLFVSSQTPRSRNLSKLLTTRFYSASTKKEKPALDPNFVTGFTDGEGSFSVKIRKKKSYRHGWAVEPRFDIGLHIKNIALLEAIAQSLGAGKIYRHGHNGIQLVVTSRVDLKVVMKFFKKHKLISKKHGDFELWCEVIELIERGEHLTWEGLRKIVAIRAAMNWGLSDKLTIAFPDVGSVDRPLVDLPTKIDPEWLAGFTSAEGSIIINIKKSQNRVGYTVFLVFVITQHLRDENLIRRIRDYLNSGHVYKCRETFQLRVTQYEDIVSMIIPLFKKYPIRGVKAEDFRDWERAAELMKLKMHLTKEGLELIRKIKAGMNRGRKL